MRELGVVSQVDDKRGVDAASGVGAAGGLPAESEAELGSLRIVARVFRGAPRAFKIYTLGGLLYGIVMTTWLLLALGSDAFVTPLFWMGAAGAGSGILLGMAHGLSAAASGDWSTRWRWRLEVERLHQMMLAMPTLAFVAGLLAVSGAVAGLPSVFRVSPIFLPAVLACLVVVYFAFRAVGQTTRFLYQHAEREAAAAAQARAEAADAQLVALQAQLNPHFLFNSLNTIAALVRTEPVAAERTVEGLSAILRRTLRRSRLTLTSLEDELDFLRAYLSVEEERLGDRLVVRWDLDPRALTSSVPPMILQPLVENALKYGIGGRLDGGRLGISARLEGERLLLTVDDDGVGFPRRVREGTGLGNTRQRLSTLYGAAGVLRIETPEVGARVVVEVPVRSIEETGSLDSI